MLQYALVRLPNTEGRFGMEGLKNATAEAQSVADHVVSDLARRQISTSPPSSIATETYVSTEDSAALPSTAYVASIQSVTTDGPSYITADAYVQPTWTYESRSAEHYAVTAEQPDYTPVPESSQTRDGAYVATRQTEPPDTPLQSSPDYLPTKYVVTTSPSRPTETSLDSYISDVQTTPDSMPLSAPTNGAAPTVLYVPRAETKGVIVITWTPSQVFLSTYLAVMLVVLYRMLISAVQTQLHLIDPFQQLATLKGAYASTTFFSSYQSQTVAGPIVALFRGRWLMCLTEVAFWFSCLIPALASEAVFVDTNWGCTNPKTGPNACPPRTTASILVIRLLQGLLAFVAIVLCVLVCKLRAHTVTGLDSDPSSITAVAALMRHPTLEHDLKELPSPGIATASSMKHEIGRKRYTMDTWYSKAGEQRYGFLRHASLHGDGSWSPSSAQDGFAAVDTRNTTGLYHPVDSDSSAQDNRTHHRWRLADWLLLTLVLGTFAVVLAYYLVSGDNGFNVFLNSNTFGPRFILTGAATVIANLWGRVEQNSMVMAPFVRLARGPAPYRQTLEFAPTITPLLSTWRAASNGYIFASVVTVMTLLAEALSVAISGVPFSTGQTWMNFIVVSYMSLAILGIMIVVLITVIVHRRNYEPKISVVPDTLGAKMSYLAGSRMLDSFDGGVGMDNLRNRQFTFKPVIEDGRRSWGVDQVHDREDEDC
ncbi:hypothetical protein Slin15195_G109590 [Septoria linicola]|uniref:Uncharacterized protein n=1 Tax=Septoria linicola TaxID=215465 RepID=A0A9Q9B3Q2_9PEZI|nr:hypothetical protein Slin15195_G109590 [Septoria linicola]